MVEIQVMLTNWPQRVVLLSYCYSYYCRLFVFVLILLLKATLSDWNRKMGDCKDLTIKSCNISLQHKGQYLGN